MATQDQHLEVINPSYFTSETASFDRFPRLPAELRLKIWRTSLKQHRILSLTVQYPQQPVETPIRYSTINKLGKLVSGGRYTATLRGWPLYSKLLRVNRESREEALKFYRVHFPCMIRTNNQTSKTGTLYFNPEYDFLNLDIRGYSTPDISAVDFLHDFKAFDPKGTGLLNLAFELNTMSALSVVPKTGEASAKEAFVATLSQVREIIWIAQSNTGRAIIGPLHDFQPITDFKGSPGIRFNHSMPVRSNVPQFVLLGRDPRPVGPELKYVATAAADPRQMRVLWQDLLTRWNVHQKIPARERVLFAKTSSDSLRHVNGSKSAKTFFKREEREWMEVQEKWKSMVVRFAGKMPVESPEELAKAVRPAFGFWLFPAEALGPLEGNISGSKKVFDMTGFWPELALAPIHQF
ncbi:hypothetical protein B0H63DRAFT_105021 [Podospora didyma]|uniref:2EXR domain-containing protein n=1 Tax=Podospora didyma TaxID=330526 RepID=A0AAE0U3U4_9PEZI|nr:hypothetical protein B0H63DRAFT_105021 [Podospora didyma]